jgi:hypothetical protein
LHLPDGTNQDVKPNAVEEPGRYCFPAVAACLTGAARLMLTLLERQVTAVGGGYAFCDTDSLAIVATEDGGMIPCPGGRHRTSGDQAAVLALSAEQVTTIRDRFETLNPYAAGALPDGLLKLEQTAHCLVISAKRYALLHLDPEAPLGFSIDVEKHSQHGLGHLLNPIDPDSDDRGWVRQFWEVLVAEALALPAPKLDWLERPAIGRFTLSTPAQLAVFASYNAKRPYQRQVKPYNFLITAIPTHFATVGHANRVRLVAPYETDPDEWLTLDWRNLHDPGAAAVHITTPGPLETTDPAQIAVKTYRTVLGDYRTRLEAKSLAPDGDLCRPGTVGLLQRRPVTALSSLVRLGKEADRVELMEADLISADEAFTVYPLRTDQLDEALAILSPLSSRELARLAVVDHRTIDRIGPGARPRRDLMGRLLRLASEHPQQTVGV